MAYTQIRASSQIQGLSLTNAQIANSTIDLAKLVKGTELQRLVDSAAQGIKAPVRAVAPANISNLSSVAVATAFDGITAVQNDRVALIGQSTTSQNGIYVVGAVSGGYAPLTRATDADEAAELPLGFTFWVRSGNSYGGQRFTCTGSDANGDGFVSPGSDGMTLTSAGSSSTGGGIPSIYVATTTNIANITTVAVPTIDGVSNIPLGSLVLVKDQTNKAENGIYEVYNSSGTNKLQRASSYNTEVELARGTKVFAEYGTFGQNHIFALMPPASGYVLGTSLIEVYKLTGCGLIQAGYGISITADDEITVLPDTSSSTPTINVTANGVSVKISSSQDLQAVSDGLKLNIIKVISNYFVHCETPSGALNGSNVTFVLANAVVPGSETLFYNGQLLEPTGDYTIDYPTKTITLNFAPIAGDKVRANYYKVA